MKEIVQKLTVKNLVLGICACVLVSCSDKDENPATPVTENKGGVFIINEGSRGGSNGSVSFFDEKSNTIQNKYFQTVNNRPLGDIVQSMFFHQEKAYVAVSNSNKIEVVNANTFEAVGVIENLEMPRFFVAEGNKGYVSETVSYTSAKGQVSVIDLTTNTVIKKIEVDAMPEQMLLHNGKLYVTCSGSNTINIINTATDAAENPITVADNPNSIVKDAQDNIWVLCGGMKNYADLTASDAGSLIKFNPAAPAVKTTYTLTDNTLLPVKLSMNTSSQKLYFLGMNPMSGEGAIYEMDATADSLSSEPLIDRNLYGLNINPAENIIYTGRLNGFTEDGWMIRYKPNGAAIDSFQVGIGPNGFSFR